MKKDKDNLWLLYNIGVALLIVSTSTTIGYLTNPYFGLYSIAPMLLLSILMKKIGEYEN